MVAPMDSKIERIIKRDGISREKALARLSTQMSDSELIKRSKYKIDNSGVDIKAQIIEILEKENIIHIKEQ
jgi:dephospho-CoA kinase